MDFLSRRKNEVNYRPNFPAAVTEERLTPLSFKFGLLVRYKNKENYKLWYYNEETALGVLEEINNKIVSGIKSMLVHDDRDISILIIFENVSFAYMTPIEEE